MYICIYVCIYIYIYKTLDKPLNSRRSLEVRSRLHEDIHFYIVTLKYYLLLYMNILLLLLLLLLLLCIIVLYMNIAHLLLLLLLLLLLHEHIVTFYRDPEISSTQFLRSVFEMSCLFLRPRPWQFEIRDSTDT